MQSVYSTAPADWVLSIWMAIYKTFQTQTSFYQTLYKKRKENVKWLWFGEKHFSFFSFFLIQLSSMIRYLARTKIFANWSTGLRRLFTKLNLIQQKNWIVRGVGKVMKRKIETVVNVFYAEKASPLICIETEHLEYWLLPGIKNQLKSSMENKWQPQL